VVGFVVEVSSVVDVVRIVVEIEVDWIKIFPLFLSVDVSFSSLSVPS